MNTTGKVLTSIAALAIILSTDGCKPKSAQQIEQQHKQRTEQTAPAPDTTGDFAKNARRDSTQEAIRDSLYRAANMKNETFTLTHPKGYKATFEEGRAENNTPDVLTIEQGDTTWTYTDHNRNMVIGDDPLDSYSKQTGSGEGSTLIYTLSRSEVTDNRFGEDKTYRAGASKDDDRMVAQARETLEKRATPQYHAYVDNLANAVWKDISAHTSFKDDMTPKIEYSARGKEMTLTREERTDTSTRVTDFTFIDSDTSGAIGDSKKDGFEYTNQVGPTRSGSEGTDYLSFKVFPDMVDVTLPVTNMTSESFMNTKGTLSGRVLQNANQFLNDRINAKYQQILNDIKEKKMVPFE